jgi:hypothetical protein
MCFFLRIVSIEAVIRLSTYAPFFPYAAMVPQHSQPLPAFPDRAGFPVTGIAGPASNPPKTQAPFPVCDGLFPGACRFGPFYDTSGIKVNRVTCVGALVSGENPV